MLWIVSFASNVLLQGKMFTQHKIELLDKQVYSFPMDFNSYKDNINNSYNPYMDSWTVNVFTFPISNHSVIQCSISIKVKSCLHNVIKCLKGYS